MKILIIGSKGDDVKKLQEKLYQLGFLKGDINVVVDGDFGKNTSQALRDYQMNKFVTGIADEKTILVLNEDTEKLDLKPIEKINIIDFPLQSNEYFSQTIEKESIFLHLTGGNKNAYFVQNGWERDNMLGNGAVATAYIVSGDDSKNQSGWAISDGQILRTFDDKFWAYHTGTGKPQLDQKSIAIEVCNWAYLTERNGRFFTWTGEEVAKENVEFLEFRGFKYWHKITDKQLKNLADLLRTLLDKYPKIKENYQWQLKNNCFDDSWSNYKESVLNGTEKGILTHTNVIAANSFLRWDIPPFPKLLEVLKNL